MKDKVELFKTELQNLLEKHNVDLAVSLACEIEADFYDKGGDYVLSVDLGSLIEGAKLHERH